MQLSANRNRLALATMVVAVACGSLVTGCSRKPTAAKAAPAPVAAPAAPQSPEEEAAVDAVKHGTRKLLNLDAPVYVDGVQKAVFRYGDLAIAPVEVLEGGTPSFAISDYLKSMGVALESVKSVHFHGNGDRIASIEGTELRKEPKRFTFTFSSGLTGAPQQRWDTEGLKNGFVTHELRKVSIFVNKAPAPIHPQSRCHLDAAGQCTEAVPYLAADAPAVKGTRVYVDGKMVGFVKRRLISEKALLGKTESGDQTYSVAKLVEGFGVDLAGVKAVEVVSGDDIVARAASEQWGKLSTNLFFTLPKHGHGKIRIHLPLEMQSREGNQDRDALVSSVVVYKATLPAQRELTPVSEDTDLSVQLASASDDAKGSEKPN